MTSSRLTSPTWKGSFSEPQCTGDDIYETVWTFTDRHLPVVEPEMIKEFSSYLEGKTLELLGEEYDILEATELRRFAGSELSALLLLRKKDDPRMYDDYLTEVLKTENNDFAGMRSRLQSEKMLRIAHSICGIANEAGELMEQFKKHVFYGAEFDFVNMLEEFGDMLWFMGIGIDAVGSSFDEVQNMNVRKLRARYKKGHWDKDDAAHRDKEQERQALQSGFNPPDQMGPWTPDSKRFK